MGKFLEAVIPLAVKELGIVITDKTISVEDFQRLDEYLADNSIRQRLEKQTER